MDNEIGFMVNHPREKALSELIGFILLLALLILVASLYLTYVVPAHGREGEIAHMDYIKGQFLDYKISTDALWINRESGVPIAQAITLGTQGVKTAGIFAGFQLFTPVFSSGELLVKGGSTSREQLVTTVTNPLYSQYYISHNDSSGYTENVVSQIVSPGQLNLPQKPSHLYLNVSTKSITFADNPEFKQYNNFPKEYGATINGPDYAITITAIPRYQTTDFNWTSTHITPDKSSDYWIRYQTDLLLTIKKNGINILDNYAVYKNIENETVLAEKNYPKNYTIDLMDPAYGFSQKDNQYSMQMEKFNETGDLSWFDVGLTATGGYVSDNISGSPVPSSIIGPVSDTGEVDTNRYMGRLEYRSHNAYYHVQQNFVYQMGGIYVNQTDGTSPLNLPLLSVSVDPLDNNILNVDLTDIAIIGDTEIGGSSPVQIQTTLNAPIRYSQLDSSLPNAGSVTLSVKNTEHPDIWYLIFQSIQKRPELSPYIDSPTQNQDTVSMTIRGTNKPTPESRDIRLKSTYVDFNVELDAVGKSVGI